MAAHSNNWATVDVQDHPPVPFTGHDDLATASKDFNPDQPRDEQGQWASGGGSSGAVPSLTSRLASRNAEDRSFAKDWSETNTEHGLKSLQDKLLGIGGYAVASAALDEKKEYQKAKLIQADGKLMSTTGAALKVPMVDQECHWNAAALFHTGKVDAIGTGYALGAGKHVTDDTWFPHSWGIKDGKIVETTKANFPIKKYFGITLTGKDARRFVSAAAQNNIIENIKEAKKWNP
jgi:hypothetical protein